MTDQTNLGEKTRLAVALEAPSAGSLERVPDAVRAIWVGFRGLALHWKWSGSRVELREAVGRLGTSRRERVRAIGGFAQAPASNERCPAARGLQPVARARHTEPLGDQYSLLGQVLGDV